MSPRILLFCAFGLAACVFAVAADAPKCRQNGEYCQVHWDCCSGTCLTYLYKCTRSHQFSSPYNPGPSIFLPPPIPAASKPSVSLDDLIGSVFPGGEETYHQTLGNRISLDEEKGAGDETQPPTKESTEPDPPCKRMGLKCYKNSECCTERCHGFLHQCVT